MLWTPMLAGIVGAASPAAALVPGTMPAWGGVRGTVFNSATMPATRDIAVPAHSSGNLLLLWVSLRNTDLNANLDSINTAGWAQLGGAGNTYGFGTFIALGLGWKIGNGSETVVNITTSGGTTTDAIQAAVDVYTAADGFHGTAVQGIAATSGASSSISMPSVTASDVRELAVAYLNCQGIRTMAAATGESGGDWTEAIAETTAGNAITTGVQTAGLSGGGTISGGTAALDASPSWNGVGFTLVPALV